MIATAGLVAGHLRTEHVFEDHQDIDVNHQDNAHEPEQRRLASGLSQGMSGFDRDGIADVQDAIAALGLPQDWLTQPSGADKTRQLDDAFTVSSQKLQKKCKCGTDYTLKYQDLRRSHATLFEENH